MIWVTFATAAHPHLSALTFAPMRYVVVGCVVVARYMLNDHLAALHGMQRLEHSYSASLAQINDLVTYYLDSGLLPDSIQTLTEALNRGQI